MSYPTPCVNCSLPTWTSQHWIATPSVPRSRWPGTGDTRYRLVTDPQSLRRWVLSDGGLVNPVQGSAGRRRRGRPLDVLRAGIAVGDTLDELLDLVIVDFVTGRRVRLFVGDSRTTSLTWSSVHGVLRNSASSGRDRRISLFSSISQFPYHSRSLRSRPCSGQHVPIGGGTSPKPMGAAGTPSSGPAASGPVVRDRPWR